MSGAHFSPNSPSYDLYRDLERYLDRFTHQSTDTSADETRKAALDWRKFAAAAGASLAATQVGHAEVVHVVPNSPIAIQTSNPYSSNVLLDFNLNGPGNPLGDTQIDFQFGLEAYQTTGFTLTPTYLSQTVTFQNFIRKANVQADGINQGVMVDGSLNVRALSSGANISSGAALQTGGNLLSRSSTYGGPVYFGNFLTSEPGFVGVTFSITGNTHTGWIRVQVTNPGQWGLEILEWAYENVAGAPLQAGQTSGGEPGLPGDYSGNGTVGPEDYDEWKQQVGLTAVPPGSGADGNADGAIDSADYAIWLQNLGQTANGVGTSSGSIPEPQTVSLGVLALGAAGVGALRRRNQAQHAT